MQPNLICYKRFTSLIIKNSSSFSPLSPSYLISSKPPVVALFLASCFQLVNAGLGLFITWELEAQRRSTITEHIHPAFGKPRPPFGFRHPRWQQDLVSWLEANQPISLLITAISIRISMSRATKKTGYFLYGISKRVVFFISERVVLVEKFLFLWDDREMWEEGKIPQKTQTLSFTIYV